MNRIQFQPGLSMPEFLKDYGTEAQCEQALETARWSEGFFVARDARKPRTTYSVTARAKSFNAPSAAIKPR